MDQQTPFDEFWNAYPKRVGRKKAEEAFKKAIKKTTLAVMLESLIWQREQPNWQKDGGAYIPYPQGWLNGERWTDEPYQGPSRPTTAPRGSTPPPLLPVCVQCKRVGVDRVGNFCPTCKTAAGLFL